MGLHHANTEDIQKVLKEYKLKMNINKTEFTTLGRIDNTGRNTQKVGTLIRNKEDNQKREIPVHCSNEMTPKCLDKERLIQENNPN